MLHMHKDDRVYPGAVDFIAQKNTANTIEKKVLDEYKLSVLPSRLSYALQLSLLPCTPGLQPKII